MANGFKDLRLIKFEVEVYFLFKHSGCILKIFSSKVSVNSFLIYDVLLIDIFFEIYSNSLAKSKFLNNSV